tara:strand:+ start:667 stop:924 length:258 start_codon:yes stop_codon:yes gene_type:complete
MSTLKVNSIQPFTPTEAVLIDSASIVSGSLGKLSVKHVGFGATTQISFESLPSSDPGVAGRLFTTQSAGTGGNLDGKLVLLVSAG